MKVIVQFSGGKDSEASLIWAVNKYGVEKVEAVFCDTVWENQLTYQHIMDVIKKLGVKYVMLTTKKFDGFLGMVAKKKRFPSTKARFCTEELKTKPMIDYVLQHSEHLILIQGVRADESKDRAKMKAQCTYFKYYYQPYGKDKKGKLKFHTYRKKDVFKWREQYADDIIRPVFTWTGQQVIDYIIENGHKPNPLYSMGMNRVGCFPCVMCKLSEIKQIADRFPEHIKKVADAEKKYNTSFFTHGKIPDRYCSKEKNGVRYPTIEDVVNYVQRFKDQIDAFKEETTGNTSCMSFYGTCE